MGQATHAPVIGSCRGGSRSALAGAWKASHLQATKAKRVNVLVCVHQRLRDELSAKATEVSLKITHSLVAGGEVGNLQRSTRRLDPLLLARAGVFIGGQRRHRGTENWSWGLDLLC